MSSCHLSLKQSINEFASSDFKKQLINQAMTSISSDIMSRPRSRSDEQYGQSDADADETKCRLID